MSRAVIRGIAEAVAPSLRLIGRALDSFGIMLEGDSAFVEKLDRFGRYASHKGKVPMLSPGVFVAPNAAVIGDVSLGAGSTVWYGAVLRGDVHNIKIGAHTQIGDRVVVHVSRHNARNFVAPTVVGDNVLIGPSAILHACTVEDGAVIGAGAILLDGVVVEKAAVVAAGAVVPPNTVVKAGTIFAGNPAKQVRAVTHEDVAAFEKTRATLSELAGKHQAEHRKTVEDYEKEAFEREYIVKSEWA